jgi:CheY-like chemotaxis protein
MQMHRISVRAVDAPAEPLAEPTLLALPRRLDGIAVLCVDDDAETCEVLSLVLRAAGAHVRTAADATTAFVAVEEAPPDVLISDIEMPGEDGYSLLQKIRAATSPTIDGPWQSP